MSNKNRNYKAEYNNYHGTEEQKKRRAVRNAARRMLMRQGRVRKGDGKDVDHISGLHNAASNLRVLSKSVNRSIK
jgi:hypothetical protein